MYLRKVRQILLCMPILLVLTACGNSTYMGNAQLQKSDYLTAKQKKKIAKDARRFKQFGAIVLNHKKEIDEFDDDEITSFSEQEASLEKAPRVFLLKRKKQTIMAETVLFDNKGKEHKTMFDRSYFTVGADRKKKHFGMRFRFLY